MEILRAMSMKSILFVEDEEDIQDLVSHKLARKGYRAECVGSGELALEVVRRRSFDLIILDLMLPGINGLEVARRLKNDAATRHIPIVMLTAKSEDADVVAGLEIGAEDYITKPFSQKVLLARIRNVLRRKDRQTGDTPSLVSVPGSHLIA